MYNMSQPSVPPTASAAPESEYVLSGLLSDAWAFFQKHFKLVALTVLALSVPLHVLQSLFVDYRGSDILIENPNGWESVGWSFISPAAWVAMVIGSLIGIIIPLSVARLTDALQHGETIDFRVALSRGFQKWGAGLVTMLVMGVLLALLFFALIIPGIIFAVYWMFVVIVVALTDKTLLTALSYSRALVRGRWWKLFGYALVMALISWVVLWVVGFVLGLFGSNYISDVIGNIAGDLVGAFYVVAGVFLFRNLQRITKLDVPPPPAS